jgi:antitoxin (DNA-binding transcriptional repressor) of toxin-antitoxin stability system
VKERRIGIRELKSQLSRCVRDVKRGATILVTERGRPVARIAREAPSRAARIDMLRNAGSIQWSGRRLNSTRPIARLRGKRTIAEIVVENRE